jgi:hypothetical protein
VGVSPDRVLTPIESVRLLPGGTYDGIRVIGKLEIGKAQRATNLSNCRIEGAIITWSPVNLTNCTVTGGVYSYDTGGSMTNTLVDSDAGQAFRPGTERAADRLRLSTPWTLTNVYLRVTPGAVGDHVEAAQVLGGVGIVFNNVVFDTGGPFNNTQTADLNVIGANLSCIDCTFVGYGGYSIYADGPNNQFVRPRFARNYRFGLVFPGGTQPLVIDPRHLDGTPA